MTDIPIPGRKPEVPFRYSPAAVTEDLKSFVRQNEDSFPYFYKDTKDNMTIGIGMRVPDLDAARQLPLYTFEGQKPLRPATPAEIDEVWQGIQTLPDSQVANFYNPVDHNLPNLKLRDPDIEFLFEQRLREGIVHLEKQTPGFATVPPSPRKVMSDMEYNMGPSRFNRAKWPNLFGAIDRRDWEAAAVASERDPKGGDRNAKAYDGFRRGAAEDRRGR